MENQDRIGKTLEYIARTYGREILRNAGRCLAYFEDVAPQLEQERRELEHFFACGGLSLAEAGDAADSADRIRRVRDRMTLRFGAAPRAAEQICQSYLSALTGKLPEDLTRVSPASRVTSRRSEERNPSDPPQARNENTGGSTRQTGGGTQQQNRQTGSTTPARPRRKKKWPIFLAILVLIFAVDQIRIHEMLSQLHRVEADSAETAAQIVQPTAPSSPEQPKLTLSTEPETVYTEPPEPETVYTEPPEPEITEPAAHTLPRNLADLGYSGDPRYAFDIGYGWIEEDRESYFMDSEAVYALRDGVLEKLYDGPMTGNFREHLVFNRGFLYAVTMDNSLLQINTAARTYTYLFKIPDEGELTAVYNDMVLISVPKDPSVEPYENDYWETCMVYDLDGNELGTFIPCRNIRAYSAEGLLCLHIQYGSPFAPTETFVMLDPNMNEIYRVEDVYDAVIVDGTVCFMIRNPLNENRIVVFQTKENGVVLRGFLPYDENASYFFTFRQKHTLEDLRMEMRDEYGNLMSLYEAQSGLPLELYEDADQVMLESRVKIPNIGDLNVMVHDDVQDCDYCAVSSYGESGSYIRMYRYLGDGNWGDEHTMKGDRILAIINGISYGYSLFTYDGDTFALLMTGLAG